MTIPEMCIIGNPAEPDAVGNAPSNLSGSEREQLIEAIRDNARVVMLPLGQHRISREDNVAGRPWRQL